MASGIIPIFKHLLKLCVFFLNTINITLKGLLLFFSLFLLKKERKKQILFFKLRDCLQHN